MRRSIGLDGPWWYRQIYAWLWEMRYPNRVPPERLEAFGSVPRKAANE
jgi:hypothetical protein